MAYRIWLCPVEQDLEIPNPDCPKSELHTPSPSGYMRWHDWASRMAYKHSQSKCPGCGLYVIWTPRGGFAEAVA
jgi:hypothetical protein